MSKIFKYQQPFKLESGKSLPEFHLAYSTFGKLNEEKNNVVWIFHALTANDNPLEWWPGLVGEGFLFNPEKQWICQENGAIRFFDRIEDCLRATALFLHAKSVWVGIGQSSFKGKHRVF